MNLLPKIIEAIDVEIQAQKRRGTGKLPLREGNYLRDFSNAYLYEFSFDNRFARVEDIPAKIIIGGQEYSCTVVSTKDDIIHLLLEKYLGVVIPKAELVLNSWKLLEKLKSTYQKTENAAFTQSYNLFTGKVTALCKEHVDPILNKQNVLVLNESQRKAISSSLNESLSVVWGPPGTGKTRTIAIAIEQHIRLGRKVVLLSHSNNAVDEALIRVAEETKNSFYQDGKIVRVGFPKEEFLKEIESTYPLLLPQNIISQKTAELEKQKSELLSKIAILKKQVRKYEDRIIIQKEIKDLKEKISQLEDSKRKNENEMAILENEISKRKIQNKEARERLNTLGTGGFIARLFEPSEFMLKAKLEKNESKIETARKNKESLILKTKNIKDEIKQNTLLISNLSNKLNQITDSNNSLSDNEESLKKCNLELESLQEVMKDIENKIHDISTNCVKNALLLGTTLTKFCLSEDLWKNEYDILVLDEASMASLPYLFMAASKIKGGFTIVGDPFQLSPIAQSNNRWFVKNIFNVLHKDEVDSIKDKMLNVQYRMHPKISAVPNRVIYQKTLVDAPSTLKKIVTDNISGQRTLCLIDTSAHNPWCAQLDNGGRINIFNALLAVNLAKKVLDSTKENESVGIITPYKKQARLIQKIAQDLRVLPSNRLKIDVVHTYQGQEEKIIIFDSVEGQGSKKWSFLNDQNLLNVAITRAECKLYLIANPTFCYSHLNAGSLFLELLNYVRKEGLCISPTDIRKEFIADNLDSLLESIITSESDSVELIPRGYFEYEFWPAFYNDILEAQKEIIIFSPFYTDARVNKLLRYFKRAIERGVNIYLLTLSPYENRAGSVENNKEVLMKLIGANINVKFREKMHEKFALIDKKIKWVGSLNILSHNSNSEYMERHVGVRATHEVINKYDLTNYFSDRNLSGNICKVCAEKGLDNFITIKSQRKNKSSKFFCCTGFPDHRWTKDIKFKYGRYHF